MKVEVDSNQIQQLEGSVETYMLLMRALTMKHGNEKGIVRISQADMNKSEAYTFNITQLKQGVKLQVKRTED